MPFFGASDIDAALRDSGVLVTVGAVTARGLEDAVDEDMLRDTEPALQGRVRSVRVKTGTFTLAVKGDITVDGMAYKVHSIVQLDDGAITRVECVLVN